MVFAFSLGNTDEVFSVDADTGNLTMNKIVTSPDFFLLQVMVSYDITASHPAQLDFKGAAAWVQPESTTSVITRFLLKGPVFDLCLKPTHMQNCSS